MSYNTLSGKGLSAIVEDVETKGPTLTKVIATIGGKSRTVEELSDLLEAGMNVARFDFSFGDHAYHTGTLKNLREAMRITGKLCCTMMDTKGPEISVDRSPDHSVFDPADVAPDPIAIEAGSQIIVTTDTSKPCSEKYLPVNTLPSVVIGDIIFVGQYLFTGSEVTSLYLEVTEINGSDVVCTAKNSAHITGLLLNLQVSKREVQDVVTLGPKEITDITEWCIPHKIDFVSLSFCKSADDVQKCKDLLAAHGAKTKVIAKVEREGGLVNFDSILKAADGIIFSRGCLGLDIPSEKMFLIQKWACNRCNNAGKPVVVTRVMDTMSDVPRPTRAEATDVANAVLDGADAIMLGAETLRGNYAKDAVECVKHICNEAEQVFDREAHFKRMERWIKNKGVEETQAEALSSSAVKAATKVGARFLAVMTETGTTARFLSKYRPLMPIYSVVTPRLQSDGLQWNLQGEMEARQSLLSRGVFPVLSARKDHVPLDLAFQMAYADRICTSGDYGVVCQRVTQGHSIVKVVEVPVM